MKFVFLGLLLMGSSAFAEAKIYDVAMSLTVNGKLVSSPRVRTNAGENVFIQFGSKQETFFLDVVAKEDNSMKPNAIMMNFKIGKVLPSGEHKVLSTPTIITLENQEGEISVGENNKEEYSLKVKANTVTL